MLSLLSAPRRGLAAGLTGVLVASAASVLASAPAQAAPATGELKWNVSQQFVEHLFFSKAGPVLPTTPSGTVSGGAAHAAGDPATGVDDLFTFPAAAVSEAADGTLTKSYAGTVRGAFVNGGTEFYSVTLSDPVVVVSPTGAGEIRATVTGTDPSGTTAPSQVTVAEFVGASSTGATTTVTPSWEDVLAPGSQQALDLGISDTTRPVDGKSFHPAFLGALPGGVRAHFYYSTSGDHKRPGSIAATATLAPRVTATVTASSYADGVKIKVDGAGFNPATNPGDAGVYVALAPTGTVINYADRSSMASFPAVDYIAPNRFAGDTFGTVLTAATDKLVSGTSYSVYTWQAHTHSNTTQDTVTPVAIDWATLTAPAPAPTKVDAKLKVNVKKKPSATKKGKVVIQVRGGNAVATGKVTAKVKAPGKKARMLKARINAKGKAVVKLPKLPARGKRGTYKLVVKYAGDAAYAKARTVKKFNVR